MCDYSLKTIKSRRAEQGDKLKVHDFGTGTTGFRGSDDKAPTNTATAVCLLPGTEIAFSAPVQVKAVFKKSVARPPIDVAQVATLVQVNKMTENAHHDALEFSDGTRVLLTWLEPGQEAQVITLPAEPKTEAERETQRRAVYA